ncbi:DUF3108 domain-containing protein [Piscinibacter terrae]|uniref:DUF3108 domain-containing protein n=1 Tax=Piscinibacter terrae TaxID=2496871 RepID=UPI00138728AD|nr:DUF3108 domain-containing protein [Albitalea terrae]
MLAVPLAAAAVLHAVLLTMGDELHLQVEPARTAAMQVRAVAAPQPPVVPVVQEPAPAPAGRPLPIPTQKPTPTPAPAKPDLPKPAPKPPEPTPVPVDSEPPPPQLAKAADPPAPVNPDMVVQVAAPAANASTPSQGETVPVYKTVLPPAFKMRYSLNRGFFSGSGELNWKPSGDKYELRLDGTVAGMTLLTQQSGGLIDAYGIAPVRFTDTRSRKGTAAANFQRDKGKITYSGPTVEVPLIPGAQDRLSWMVQISGVLNADPRLAAPDGKVTLFVTGSAGDADVWIFRYAGTENLRTDSGIWKAVKFTREPRKAYDRTVEVWLAPTRNHLPIRARFTASADGAAFELLLRDIESP